MFDRTPFLASTFPQPPKKIKKIELKPAARARARVGRAADRGGEPPNSLREEPV